MEAMIGGVKRSDIFKWIITIVLSAIFFFIPEQGIYTHEVRYFMTITVFGLCLAAFELVHIMFISIVMPSLWVFFKVASAEVVMSPWVGTTFLMIVGALFMAATLEDCGLLQRIAYYLMCKVKGSYFWLLFSIMLVTILINILTSGRGYLVMAPLAAGLCMSLGGMNKRLGAGLATAVMLGGAQSHTYTYYAIGWGIIQKAGTGYLAPGDITPLSILLHCWPLFVVSLITLCIVSKWFKPEEAIGDITFFQEKLSKMGNITKREKTNAVMLALVLIYIFTINIHKLDLNLGFALIPWMVYLPFLDGADANTMKKMNMPIIFFVAACMSIGVVAADLGLGTPLIATCQSLLDGSTSPVAIVSIVFGVTFLLNFVMTPMAIMALLGAPLFELVTSMGFSPIPFAYTINACVEAILLPYEYVPYLLIYSFGMISMKDFIKVNVLRSILFFLGIIGLLVPYWMLIGLL